VLKAKLALDAPRLVEVPFTRGADGVLHAPGLAARVPPILLRGGPELEAQRATVHRAARELGGSA
jgi:hypothetical protein